MSDKTVYGIQERGDDLLITGLARAGDARWRVTEWLEVEAEAAPPRGLCRDMAADPLDVAWVLRNNEVQVNAAALPHLKPKEMSRAVAGWIAREEKAGPDAHAFAWRELPAAAGAGADARRDLVLTYAERETVQARLDRAAAWDVKPGRMLAGYMALDAFFRLAGPRAEGPEVWNLVFVGGTTNFLCVGSQDSLLMTRPLPADLSGGEDRDEYVQRLATEVSRSLFFARQSAGSPEVGRIVVCGDADLAPALAERLRPEQAIPVDHWDLAAHFDPGDHALGADALPLLAAAALGGVTGALNLLPEPRRLPLSKRTRRRLALAAVVLGATITPALWFAGSTLTTVQEDYLRGARRQLSLAQRDAREAQALYREVQAVQARRETMAAHRSAGPELDRLLLDLAAAAPVQVTFTDLSVRAEDGVLRLSLVGESRASSAERAQRAFLDFAAALARDERLAGAAEPRVLEIDEPPEPDARGARVHFALDYDLTTPEPGGEG